MSNDPREAIGELLGEAIMNGARRQDKPMSPLQREAAAMTLKEVAQRYHTNPFKVGDLVTPREAHNVRHAGEPHVVVEVFDPPVRVTQIAESAEMASPHFYARCDVRIVCMMNDDIMAFMMESWKLKPYTGEGSE
jgi:hypothetical protein